MELRAHLLAQVPISLVKN